MTPHQRRGRRPGSPDTAEQILAAARAELAEKSAARTTVRAVASRAGVDPALVHHYFGTRADLIAAAFALPVQPSMIAERLAGAEPGDRGEALVRLIAEVWGEGESGRVALGLVRSAMADEASAARLREAVVEVIRPTAARALGVDPEAPELTAAFAALVGTMLARGVLWLEPLASMSADALVALWAPVVQELLERARASGPAGGQSLEAGPGKRRAGGGGARLGLVPLTPAGPSPDILSHEPAGPSADPLTSGPHVDKFTP